MRIGDWWTPGSLASARTMYVNSHTMQTLRDRIPAAEAPSPVARITGIDLVIDEGIPDGDISPWPSSVYLAATSESAQ